MNTHKNTNALYVGIFLIIAIFLITYIRMSHMGSKKDDANVKFQDEISSTLGEATKISAAQLAQKMDSNEALNIIDIREESDYSVEHLPESMNIPLLQLRESIKILDKHKSYVIVDSNPSLTTTAYGVKTFSEAGFIDISYLEGGFSSWKSKYNQTISSGDPTRFSDQSKVNYITSDNLKEMLEKEKNITIIDVRKNTRYSEGHLKNAVNIFLEDIESKKDDIPVNRKIVLYDDNGLSAFQAAVRLFDMGIFNSQILADGLDDWKSKKYEVVK